MLFLQIVLALPLLLLCEIVLYRKFLLKGMQYKRSLSKREVFEGEKIAMFEEIENNNFLPIASMKAESRIGPYLLLGTGENIQSEQGGYHRSVFSIMPFYRIKRTYAVTCLKRGEFDVGNVTITASDIFGFVSKIVAYNHETKLIVYPAPLPENQMAECLQSLQGDTVVRRFINPDPFIVAGVRQYQNNDPMSAISWKATARTNTLQVYNYDYTSDSRLLIIFNIDSSSRQDPFPNEEECGCIEYGIHFCASIVGKSIGNGMAAGFCSNGHYKDETEHVYIPARCSKAQLYVVLEAMARLQLHRTVSFGTLIKRVIPVLAKDTGVLIVTLYMDEIVRGAASELRSAGHAVETMVLSRGRENQ